MEEKKLICLRRRRYAAIFLLGFVFLLLGGCGAYSGQAPEQQTSGAIAETTKPVEETTEPTEELLQEHAHDYAERVVASTCTTDGYTVHFCLVCSQSYQDTVIKAPGHSYKDAVVTVTCTDDGYIQHTCSVCGDTYRDGEQKATGHSYAETVVAATCTTDGYTQHTCSVCGDAYKDAEQKTAGHSYAETLVAATCTTNGYTQHTCSVCGDTYKDAETKAAGHSWEDPLVRITRPDYSQAGEYRGICSVCKTQEQFSVGCLVATSEHARQQILQLVNAQREAAGLPALEYYADAQIASDARAQEVHLKFSHDRPDGTKCETVLDDYAIGWETVMGENIALGYDSAESVMEGWMGSPGHKDNILKPTYKYMTVGEFEGGWVQLFFG